VTPERFRQIERLFHEARTRPLGVRGAFLAEACGGDEALRREVESLLAQPEFGPGVIDTGVRAMAADLATAPAASLIGRRLGVYEIRAVLGSGGMGEVYRARDTRLGRDVAIKILPPAFTREADRLARFEREACVLASLDHPNIATIHGVEEGDGVRALVLALVEGETLAERLAHGPLSLAEALAYGRQIADALQAAHDAGIVHRDLKPGNIMITPSGLVKVLDFGLAKPAEGTPAAAASQSPTMTIGGTREGVILGTAAYMSPEQARGQAVDKRSDIWAFGCVVFEMLTGRAAFARDTVTDTLVAVIERQPDWQTLPAPTPPYIVRLLRRCLEKDARRRLKDIGDAALDIDDVLAEAGGKPPGPDLEVERSWRSRALTTTLASVAVVGLITAAAIVVNGRLRSSAETNSVRQYVVLPPADSAFGVGVVDRTPSFAISPDARRLVFAASSPGIGLRLWLRPLDALTAYPIPGTEGAASPFWSPDGLSVGFFADGKLKRVDVAGGMPLTIADASSGSGGSWNRNGDIVYAPTPQGPLWYVAAAGGTPTAITRLGAGDLGHVRPQFLPDGRHFLYLVRAAAPRRGIYVSSVDSPEPKWIVAARERALYAAPGYLLFLREGRLFGQPFDAQRLQLSGDAVPLVDSVAFISTEGRASYDVADNGTLVYRVSGVLATTQPLWVDRSGRVIGPVSDPADYQTTRLSPDGSRLAVELHDVRSGTGDLWIIDLATGQKSRFTFDGMHNNEGVWSPDGRQLVFVGRPNGVRNLHLKPVDGSTGDEPLLAPGHDRMPLDWSPDGRHVLFREDDPDTNMDVWVLRMPERRPIPFLRTPFREEDAKFSPDGRWVAYMSNETGRDEIYVASFPEGTAKRKVSLNGGRAPRWSRDGKEFFFVESNRTILVAPASWNGQPMFGVPRPLFTHEMRAGSPLTSADVWFDVSGRRFLILPPPAGPAPPAPPLTVVENWPALLRRR
jgi:eukaryotic-like serine/threonine-protein kinase